MTRQIDDVELQQKKLEPVEAEKRATLNRLRGLPTGTLIDISKTSVARDGGREVIEGEQAAMDAYLMVALELQTLAAKKEIFSQQLARVRAAKDGAQGKGEGSKRD